MPPKPREIEEQTAADEVIGLLQRLADHFDGPEPVPRRCRAQFPARTTIAGIVGHVSFGDGTWFEDKGYAVVVAQGKELIVHPAQAVITLLPEPPAVR